MYVQLPLLEKKMVTLFADTFKSSYYEHLMGSSAQYFYYAIVNTERIEQGIRVERILKPTKKKGFTKRRKDAGVSNVEGGYKSKKNYQTQS